jgi:oligopeptide transport system substrate-binding protein
MPIRSSTGCSLDEEYGKHALSAGHHPPDERILHHDAPWVFGLHPKSYTLGHRWLKNRKPNDVGNNILKYQRIDAEARAQLARKQWNRPVLWPIGLGALVVLLAFIPAILGYRRREQRAAVK